MDYKELLASKLMPPWWGPDPAPPWLRVIDQLEHEQQLEAFSAVLEYNKAALVAQKTLLDAQHQAIDKVIKIIGSKQKTATAR